jgi:molybdate transport system regulatory protein
VGKIFSAVEKASVEELSLLRREVDEELRRREADGCGGGPDGEDFRAQPELYAVAEGVKYLTSRQLERATQCFREWFQSSRTSMQSRSRGRVWMSFLLIRYGALRLGELLSLNDLRDIDPADRSVSVGGSNARTIHLPGDVSGELASMLKLPMYYTLRGKVFKIDQGYLRRKFYERAKECSLPGYLLNPRVTRHSRSIELLRAGMPVKVVQAFMGWQSQDPATGFLVLSDGASRRVMERFLEREIRRKTSARNVFAGRIESVSREGVMDQVVLTTASGLKISAAITEESLNNLGLAEGSAVTASIKATLVLMERICPSAEETKADRAAAWEKSALAIFPERPGILNASNNFTGMVTRVALSEYAAEVQADLSDGHKVSAVLTRERAELLDLKPGSEVVVCLKGLAVVGSV